MFHQSQKTARAAMGAIGLLVLLFLLAACGSVSPTLAAASLLQGAPFPNKATYFAGYTANSPVKYSRASVAFTVPFFQQPTGGPKVAYGVMLGNPSRSDPTLDAGIYSYLDPSGQQINQAYGEFYDPNNPGLSQSKDLVLTGGQGHGRVSPGDAIYVNIGWEYLQGAYEDFFDIQDHTTGDSILYITGKTYLVSAACGVLVSLADPQPPADFGMVNMQGCGMEVEDIAHTVESGRPINSDNPTRITMVSASFGASPSLLGDDGFFSVTWNAQPQGQ